MSSGLKFSPSSKQSTQIQMKFSKTAKRYTKQNSSLHHASFKIKFRNAGNMTKDSLRVVSGHLNSVRPRKMVDDDNYSEKSWKMMFQYFRISFL